MPWIFVMLNLIFLKTGSAFMLAPSRQFSILPTKIIGINKVNGLKASFEIIDERDAYSGWRKIVHRDIKMPLGNIATFDIMKQNDPAVLVFSWFTKTSTTTLIRELSPGRMELNCGVVAGICESGKHKSTLQAAQYELEEEAHLTGGTWVPMLEEPSTVNSEKYSTGVCYPYLVIDPTPKLMPRALDAEEYIEIEEQVSPDEVIRRVLAGEMNIVSCYTCLLAIEKLKKLGMLQT